MQKWPIFLELPIQKMSPNLPNQKLFDLEPVAEKISSKMLRCESSNNYAAAALDWKPNLMPPPPPHLRPHPRPRLRCNQSWEMSNVDESGYQRERFWSCWNSNQREMRIRGLETWGHFGFPAAPKSVTMQRKRSRCIFFRGSEFVQR